MASHASSPSLTTRLLAPHDDRSARQQRRDKKKGCCGCWATCCVSDLADFEYEDIASHSEVDTLRSEPGHWRPRAKHHLLFPSPQLIQIRTLRRELAVPFAPSSRAGMVVCQQCPCLVAYLRPACLARNRVEGAATVSVG